MPKFLGSSFWQEDPDRCGTDIRKCEPFVFPARKTWHKRAVTQTWRKRTARRELRRTAQQHIVESLSTAGIELDQDQVIVQQRESMWERFDKNITSNIPVWVNFYTGALYY